jgi:hypothetical protein
LVIIIVLIGFFQDRIFTYLDKTFFPHKYLGVVKGSENQQPKLISSLFSFTATALFWVFLAVYGFLFLNEFVPILTKVPVLSDLFGQTVLIIHFYFLLILIYQIYTRFFVKTKFSIV